MPTSWQFEGEAGDEVVGDDRGRLNKDLHNKKDKKWKVDDSEAPEQQETVVVQRKWEHEMKEREALDPKALEALEAEAKRAMESVVISTA
eukprot:CAMPEP_0194493008 /NCGR_PEP_ID=MMETSP0253-20130528/11360_1 /TAXON_ID=2966 /ORGANISM="Noctiluca scintillans" /LENGTH=89 /DNA_ID=CAMNT_0039333941 /DNA_START=100 /DNA_END=369 /DNA_ORIENTATION=+